MLLCYVYLQRLDPEVELLHEGVKLAWIVSIKALGYVVIDFAQAFGRVCHSFV